jgi:2-polyprenyl-3-methyl-5-hydroxy-6-metoxy-1,4-benzoquinol methylase
MYTKFNNQNFELIKGGNKPIYKFSTSGVFNIDPNVVFSFGEEWEKFFNFTNEEINIVGNEYFGFIDNVILNKNLIALDIGCGTGRWTKYLASKVKFVEAIDPSKAILYADKLLSDVHNVRLSMASTDNIPFEDETFDFVMSVGVLHHIPDTRKAMFDCVKKVKKGGYFYVYLYYKLDNRGLGFKFIFHISDAIRRIVSSLPNNLKKIVADFIAYFVYVPLVYLGKFIKSLGFLRLSKKMPLSAYQNKSIFIIRNDALDRFGTSLEQRFTKNEIISMMESCGLTNIIIPDGPIYWCAIGKKL